MPPDRSTAWNLAATATMPAERPQPGVLAPLDALVKGALAEALVELPGVAGLAGGALGGEQSALDTLGRGFVRRDPVAGLDPLPEGGDSAIFSTAAIASGREPGQHWPELNAFRLSKDFPGGAFDPLRVAERAGRNFLPALMFPESPPSTLIPKPPSGQVTGEGAAVPSSAPSAPWLVSDAQPAATGNRPTVSSADALPPWLGELPASEVRRSGARRLGLRRDFPALDQQVHGHRLVWLDSAATTQKPREVIAAITRFYERDNS